MIVLGVKIRGHDTGAALIADGRVVAVAEERLNRVKHSFNMFPTLSIAYCLDALAVKAEDVSLVVIDQIGLRSKIPMREIFERETKGAFSGSDVTVINHHDAHAASAFFCSPFDEAAILVYDGSGEQFETHYGVLATETETLYVGRKNVIIEIDKMTHVRRGTHFLYTTGIGKIYSYLSAFYLNFGAYNEGKMMGLASYGTDALLKDIPPDRWFREERGRVLCNSRFVFPRGVTRVNEKRHIGKLVVLRLKNAIRRARLRMARVFASRGDEASPLFSVIRLPQPRRDSSIPLPNPYYNSVAYAGQKILEMVAVCWGKRLRAVTGLDNLCIAGGVGLNIDANKNFLDTVGFKRLFVQPAASDTGIALGCALYGAHMSGKEPRTWCLTSASLGRVYAADDIEKAIAKHASVIDVRVSDHATEEAAEYLSRGHIVGWFTGGSEYGPRALGNRSILADPRVADMKDILNNRVKHRESWRPFAASVLESHMREYFDLDHPSPFMLLAASVCEDKKKEVPAIVHVDGTCRIQSVTHEANERYHDLLDAFYRKTGVPLVLNTSFNLGGDPIVETPDDALDTFLATDFDYLFLEDYVIRKKGV